VSFAIIVRSGGCICFPELRILEVISGFGNGPSGLENVGR
jgi:hypothetical protein